MPRPLIKNGAPPTSSTASSSSMASPGLVWSSIACKLDPHLASIDDVAVQPLHGILGVSFLVEPNESETPGLFGVRIPWDVYVTDFPVFLKYRLNLVWCHPKGEVVHFEADHPFNVGRPASIVVAVHATPSPTTSSSMIVSVVSTVPLVAVVPLVATVTTATATTVVPFVPVTPVVSISTVRHVSSCMEGVCVFLLFFFFKFKMAAARWVLLRMRRKQWRLIMSSSIFYCLYFSFFCSLISLG